MPIGTCPKCGAVYYGWALLNEEEQNCEKCGTKLNITEHNPKPKTTARSEVIER